MRSPSMIALVACLLVSTQVALALPMMTASAPAPAPMDAFITLAELAEHADPENDAWIAIDGKVYDVTEFLSEHPGGPIIKNYVGRDVTERFPEVHGEEYYPGALKRLSTLPVVGDMMPGPVPSVAAQASPTGFSLAELALHNKDDDAWIAIDGTVYDVTEFIAKHPGGPVIKEWIGKDASEKLPEVHGDDYMHALEKLGTLPVVGDLAPEV